jgi:hypothetical protein
MDPINPIAGNPEALNESPTLPNQDKPKSISPRDKHWITIVTMAIFVLFSLGVVIFLYYQNQQLKNLLASYQPEKTPLPEASATPAANLTLPTISSPSANMKIASPLEITGKVPAGWMNEGVFPIKLVDAKQNLIAQGQAKENVPGTWLSGNPVSFTATLTFKTTAASGFLILENDNPSGDPANSKSFELPVVFSGINPESPSPTSIACTQDVKLCPDGSYVSRTPPNCEFAPCP